MLDFDIEDLDVLKDPEIKKVMRQLYNGGAATTKDADVSARISRALPDIRDRELILMGPDRRKGKKLIMFNPEIPDIESIMSKEFKHMIKKLR